MIWLGVWERNAGAITFDQRWSFRAVGSHLFRPGEDVQIDLPIARGLVPHGPR